MKRKLFGLILICTMILSVGLFCIVKAEGEEQPEPTYTSYIVVNSSIEHGDVLVSTECGNTGDIITITAEPSTLYVIEAVYANGNQILTNENGLYQFALVEGENTVNAKFALNNEALETIVDLVEKGKNEGFETLFQPKNLIVLICALISLITGTGLIVVVGRLKKANIIADDNATKAVQKVVPETVEKTFSPILIDLKQASEDTREIAKSLCRCFVLFQEGTPEAKLAIIDELTKVQNSNEEVANKVVAAINNAIEQAKELQNGKIKAIEELEQANNSLTNENAENSQENSNEGRY